MQQQILLEKQAYLKQLKLENTDLNTKIQNIQKIDANKAKLTANFTLKQENEKQKQLSEATYIQKQLEEEIDTLKLNIEAAKKVQQAEAKQQDFSSQEIQMKIVSVKNEMIGAGRLNQQYKDILAELDKKQLESKTLIQEEQQKLQDTIQAFEAQVAIRRQTDYSLALCKAEQTVLNNQLNEQEIELKNYLSDLRYQADDNQVTVAQLEDQLQAIKNVETNISSTETSSNINGTDRSVINDDQQQSINIIQLWQKYFNTKQPEQVFEVLTQQKIDQDAFERQQKQQIIDLQQKISEYELLDNNQYDIDITKQQGNELFNVQLEKQEKLKQIQDTYQHAKTQFLTNLDDLQLVKIGNINKQDADAYDNQQLQMLNVYQERPVGSETILKIQDEQKQDQLIADIIKEKLMTIDIANEEITSQTTRLSKRSDNRLSVSETFGYKGSQKDDEKKAEMQMNFLLKDDLFKKLNQIETDNLKYVIFQKEDQSGAELYNIQKPKQQIRQEKPLNRKQIKEERMKIFQQLSNKE